MKCPQCEIVELTIADRSGVEIDFCPACRGVWLDRGELDKIIDRVSVSAAPVRLDDRSPDRERRRDDDDDGDRYDQDRKKRSRRGFLGDLFDF